MIWLERASTDAVNFCACERALAALPGQAGCPWCGCGWLFTCLDCRKAFTFARLVEIDLTPDALIARDARNFGLDKPLSDASVAFHRMQVDALLSGVSARGALVYLDGRVLDATAPAVRFTGTFGAHRFKLLPHLTDAGRERLGSMKYWLAAERERLAERKRS